MNYKLLALVCSGILGIAPFALHADGVAAPSSVKESTAVMPDSHTKDVVVPDSKAKDTVAPDSSAKGVTVPSTPCKHH